MAQGKLTDEGMDELMNGGGVEVDFPHTKTGLRYDSIRIARHGDELSVTLGTGDKALFTFDAVKLDDTCSLTIAGVIGAIPVGFS